MADKEFRKRIYDLFVEGYITTSGHRRDNGADYYRCPSCQIRDTTFGNCNADQSWLEPFPHSPSCMLNNLFQELRLEFNPEQVQRYGVYDLLSASMDASVFTSSVEAQAYIDRVPSATQKTVVPIMVPT